ncbi:MAG: N-acetylmuramic acid 6-phosphate etherase [Vulcanimicrobiota bacterium]
MTELNLGEVATEGYLEASSNLDQMTALEIVQLMNAEEEKVRRALDSAAEAVAVVVDKVAEAFLGGGRLFYIGAGTSGRLGLLDASECPPTFGSPPEQVQGILAGGLKAFERAVEEAEDRAEDGARELRCRELTAADCVVGISASGRTPFVLGGLEEARRVGAFTAGVFCNPGAPMSTACEQPILLATGPEVVTGSTRLKAGTATKLVLNQITTGAMIRSGRVLGNLMVSLTPTCEKLVDRSIRIVSKAVECEREQAAELLDKAEGSVPVAILLGKTELNAEQARISLETEPLTQLLQRLKAR